MFLWTECSRAALEEVSRYFTSVKVVKIKYSVSSKTHAFKISVQVRKQYQETVLVNVEVLTMQCRFIYFITICCVSGACYWFLKSSVVEQKYKSV